MTLRCPKCLSDKILVTEERMVFVNTSELWRPSIVTIENNEARSTCLDCGWGGERQQLVKDEPKVQYRKATDAEKLAWVSRKRNMVHGKDHSGDGHWIVAWVYQGEPGNKEGPNDNFIARTTSFEACIEKFILGDIVRVV